MEETMKALSIGILLALIGVALLAVPALAREHDRGGSGAGDPRPRGRFFKRRKPSKFNYLA